MVASFPIPSTYGRFTWVISINVNGDYKVNPLCLNGKIDPLVFHQEPVCLGVFIRNMLYCNRKDVQVFTDTTWSSFYMEFTMMQSLC